jgi:hypothetical protein
MMPELELSDMEVQSLMQVARTEFGRVLFSVVDRLFNDAENALAASPRLCDEDFRQDIRYRLGVSAGLSQVRALPEYARKYAQFRQGGMRT